MIETKITCDKCGLLVKPLDPEFDARSIAGGGSLVILDRTNGGMGHNRVPPRGWHFHYLCFSVVVNAILSVLQTERDR
jgi:hypothetical protein